MALNNIHIGTSGWSYKKWIDLFYPKSLKPAEYLQYYLQYFDTTEINTTFYHTPRVSSAENWAAAVPSHFTFCAKMNRYITQMKKLRDPEEPLERFFTAIAPLQPKSGPVLIQLPPSLRFNYDVTEYFYSVLRRDYNQYNYALEARNTSWFEEDSLNLMAKYNIAFVISQSGNVFPYAEFVTATNIYVRFHGPAALYASPYSPEMLDSYANKFVHWMKEGHIIWAYFNNDINGYAVQDAQLLKEIINKKINATNR